LLKKILLLIMLGLLLIGIMFSIFNLKVATASGTIYIRADGTIDPPTASIQRDGNLCTFTDNLYEPIIIEKSNIILDGAGHTLQGPGNGTGIYLYSETNVTIQNINIKNFDYGIRLVWSSGNVIRGNIVTCKFDGVRLSSSSNNTLFQNIIADNGYEGLNIFHSSFNVILKNSIINNTGNGIWLCSADNNTISSNTIANNGNYGIWLHTSSNNTVFNNSITNNKEDGIQIAFSSNNNIIQANNITGNNYGIRIFGSSNNRIYHNSLVDNSIQAWVEPGYGNVWDNGFPSGGNYWGDYEERYPDANELDGSGLWDTPYVIDENNQDNYPLIPESPPSNLVLLLVLLTVLGLVFAKQKGRKVKS